MTSVFTLITASFNNLQYLDTWMDSILLQDYRPLRVVFVDDFSNDSTESNFHKYGQKLGQKDIQCNYIINRKRIIVRSRINVILQIDWIIASKYYIFLYNRSKIINFFIRAF